MFFIGICCVGRWTLAYIYLIEFWSTESIKKYAPFVNAAAALSTIFATFSIQTVTDGYTVSLTILAIFLNLIGLASAYFMPESPKFLLVHEKMDECRDALK
jgi:hypothetical protein